MKTLLKKLLKPAYYHLPRWRWRIMRMDVVFPDGTIWFGKCLFAWDEYGTWKYAQIPLFVWGERSLYRRWCNGIDRATN